ncbi:MAG: PEP-CTERM sorting domain-containing protein, partial [Isosphaeraceae bacterium]
KSADRAFRSSTDTWFVQNHPPGSIFDFGGTPEANFGWRFTTLSNQTAVPEPSTFALSLCLGLAAAGTAVVRSRRKAAACRPTGAGGVARPRRLPGVGHSLRRGNPHNGGRPAAPLGLDRPRTPRDGAGGGRPRGTRKPT